MLDTPCSEVVWRVWLPTPFASFLSTSLVVRHRVPSHFNWTLPPVQRETWRLVRAALEQSPQRCARKHAAWLSISDKSLLRIWQRDLNLHHCKIQVSKYTFRYTNQVHSLCRSRWPRCLRRRSADARLLGLWIPTPPGAWMFVVRVVCCQVEVSATNWSLVKRSPTECGASLCVIMKPRDWGGHGQLG